MMATGQKRPLRQTHFFAAAALFAGLSVSATAVHAQGITYTLAPAATSINWDKDFGLKNHSLYGGQASIDFEQLVSLQGYYFTNNKVNTAVDKLGLGGDLGAQLKDQKLQVRNMGANVIWKFWSGGIAPYLKTGGGILELRPDSGAKSKQITLNAGGGIRFGGNAPLYLDLFAEDMMLRADRYSIFNPGASNLPADPDRNTLRHNLVVGAAIGVPLGLNSNDRERNRQGSVQWGLSGASLTLEPFAGRLQFDKKSNADGGVRLRDQDLAGVRAGIDVGRYVGVRGFYWRGTDKDFKRTQSLESWGGELQFRLNSSPGLTPYLLAGAAQLNFDQKDTSALAQRSDDKLSLLLGGGVALPLGERFALTASARDYLYGQGNGADSVSMPSDLRSNWMYTVGLRVSLGGHSGSAEAQRVVSERRSMAAQMRADSIDFAAQLADARAGNRGQSGRMMRDTVMMVNGRAMRMNNGMMTSMRSDSTRATRVIMLPLPEVGELYVRYGPPQANASTKPGVMQATISADSSAQNAAAAAAAANAAAQNAMTANMSAAEREAQMNRRIDSLVTVRVNERTSNLSAPTTTIIQTPPTQTQDRVVVADQSGLNFGVVGNDQRGGLMVYSGLTVNSGIQVLLGGRFDLGPVSGNSNFHFAPEIAFGAGSGGRSTMLVGNLQYMFKKHTLSSGYTIQPHIVGGLGILNFSDRVGSRDGLNGVINLGYGVSIPLVRNPGSRATPVLTLEHQGVDFFHLNRLLVGFSWRL